MFEPVLDAHSKQVQSDYQQFFLNCDNDGFPLKAQFTRIINQLQNKEKERENRLIIDLNLLRANYPERAESILKRAQSELVMLQAAFRNYLVSKVPDIMESISEYSVGFEGSFGVAHVTPRSLTSKYIGWLVCCEGIVTKCSLVRPKVVKSVHYCPATGKTVQQRYSDMTSLEPFPSSAIYPTKDADGNLLETEFGHCKYKDYQIVTVQEMPEKSPVGHLPCSVEVILELDLVDSVKPGDRVLAVGIFRCLASKKASFINGNFRTLLIANNVIRLNHNNLIVDSGGTFLSDTQTDEQKKMASFSQLPNAFSILARSLAPSIYGHENIKKAILLQLLGGNEKILANGTRLRGDINILLVGDPSTAKSQLLRYVLSSAPIAVATTGRGSTGVGLTAAVTNDRDSGERRLEAGAMVLADRGIVCIDEFDKMTDSDRTAIHEVMEQGRVTIAKAGVHARLNARCAVLAAANPVAGRYDEYRTPMENIAMQDSLLSRFDLLFIVLDNMNEESDYRLAGHILKMHQFRSENETEGQVLPLMEDDEFLSTKNLDFFGAKNDKNDNKHSKSGAEKLKVYESKHKKLFAMNVKKDKMVTREFLMRYIRMAKELKPVLSEEARDMICEAYVNLRSQSALITDTGSKNSNSYMAKTLPVTARTLETFIRLATAHAKSRLSRVVQEEDAQVAIDLIYFSFFHHKSEVSANFTATKSKPPKENIEEVERVVEEVNNRPIEATSDLSGDMNRLMFELFDKKATQVLTMDEINQQVKMDEKLKALTQEDIKKYLDKMQEENKIMIAYDTVYLI